MAKKLAWSIILFSSVFILSLRVITDVDFGWHLRAGEYIINNYQIPTSDIFSYSMPAYPYVYHSWLGEVLVALSYKYSKLLGSTLYYACISLVSLLFVFKSAQIISKNQVSIIFMIAVGPLAYAVSGGRMRVYNFLFIAIISYLFLKFHRQNSRSIFLVPLIITLWTNLHGSFVVGIITIILLTIITIANSQSQREKIARIKVLTLTTILSVLATLISPYSFGAWKQAVNMFGYSYTKLRGVNNDWQGILDSNTTDLLLFAIILIFTLLSFTLKSKLTPISKIPLLIFFLLSLISQRFIISTVVFLIPVANEIILTLKNKLAVNIRKSPIIIFSLVILILTILLTGLKNIAEIAIAYSSPKEYANFLALKAPTRNKYPIWSYDGNLFLEKNLKEKIVLNEADWGGFMLLVNPNRKLFYYGAMDNFIVAKRSFAFDYLELVNTMPGWENQLQKYQINCVFLPNYFPLVKTLKERGDWQTVYEDSWATILVKI